MSIRVDFEKVKQIVIEAGEMLESRESASHVRAKGASDYVTETDTMVQKKIQGELLRLYPEIQFVGEEKDNGDVDFDGLMWVLDPVDGTTNLVHDYRRSCISLALLENREGIMGIVYQPYTKELFSAWKGQGAFVNGVPMHVSGAQRMSDALISVGTSPYHKDTYGKKSFEHMYRVFLDAQDVRRIGSAAIELAEAAAGRSEAFFENELCIWDYAAGMVLLQEAGGVITTYDGSTLNASLKSSIVGGTPEIHRLLVDKYLKDGE